MLKKTIKGTSVEVWRGESLAGKMNWWIIVEGSYNPVSEQQLVELAQWILSVIPMKDKE